METTTQRKLTRYEALDHLKGLGRQVMDLTRERKRGHARITFRYHSRNVNSFTFIELADKQEIGRVVVGLGPLGKPKVIHQYSTNPRPRCDMSDLPMLERKLEQRLKSRRKKKP